MNMKIWSSGLFFVRLIFLINEEVEHTRNVLRVCSTSSLIWLGHTLKNFVASCNYFDSFSHLCAYIERIQPECSVQSQPFASNFLSENKLPVIWKLFSSLHQRTHKSSHSLNKERRKRIRNKEKYTLKVIHMRHGQTWESVHKQNVFFSFRKRREYFFRTVQWIPYSPSAFSFLVSKASHQPLCNQRRKNGTEE